MIKSIDMNAEKKKVILTLCKVFPVTHSQTGKPTEFGKHLQEGVKIHTVRGNNKNLWDQRVDQIKAGKKYLSVREWSGRPYNSEQREIAQHQNVGLQHITITNSTDDSEPQCWVDDKKVSIREIAKNDGLSVEDFVEWFLKETNVFEGVIIHFTNFRY